ncbi:MAG TPA: hypothetical protein VH853_14950 [Polyangia bacterium]|jgi:hypothetical protein|nr:hypothetical protein [Polyangia bacterium]
MPRPPRPRRQQREQQRALRKTVRQIERLAGELPGGSAERPLDVTSASVVETRARATECIQCDAVEMEIRGDRATSTARGVLREVAMVCRRCHAGRTVWVRVAAGSN